MKYLYTRRYNSFHPVAPSQKVKIESVFCHNIYPVFIQHSALRQVHSLFQSDHSTQCDIELPPSNILSLSSSRSFVRLYPHFYFSFNNPLQKTVSTQNVTNPVSLPFTYFMQDIPLFLCISLNIRKKVFSSFPAPSSCLLKERFKLKLRTHLNIKREIFLVTGLELSEMCSLKYTIDCKSQRN